MEDNRELVEETTENVEEKTTEEITQEPQEEIEEVETVEEEDLPVEEEEKVQEETFTKEQVDKIIAKKIARTEDKLRRKLYKKYGKLENVVNAEDKKLADEFSDQTKYVEDGSDDELPPAKDPEYTEEDLANLNPPSDTEEEYNENDPSMEIVEGGDIKSIKDKNGNTQYYEVKDGKRRRVSKEYAASKGVDVSNG